LVVLPHARMNVTTGAFASIRRRLTPRHEERSQGRKLSPRIVEAFKPPRARSASGTTSGWGGSLALQELKGAIIRDTERFGGFDAMVATGATRVAVEEHPHRRDEHRPAEDG